ncbi:MAG: endonuclease III [Phycisphaerales bacterium]|nr:endonuclease III [Phycisphaerales bacterium]
MTSPTTTPGATSKAGFDLPKPDPDRTRRAGRIFNALSKAYPDAHCELDYASPAELLIATILSAQATDVGVNKATPGLFTAFPTPGDYARATPGDIEPHIATIGLFRNKAKAVHESMKRIHEVHQDEVPSNMEALLELRGVARKTANVVLGNAFNINMGVVVDTHVTRLSHRLDLSQASTPVSIERDLMALFPRRKWTLLSHLLIFHGRRVCKARGGSCATDPICRRWGSCSNE